MSNLVKHSEHRIIWTIGNTQIVDSEPDTGIVPLLKISALGIGAIVAAPVSPMIAVALFGYGAYKIFDLATSIGSDGANLAKDIYADVNGDETEDDSVPDGWVNLPQIEESEPVRIRTQLGEQSAIDVPVQPAKPIESPNGFGCILADPYQSRAFFGAQRTGKTYLAAVASREMSTRLGVKVFHMNLASFGTEDDHYWSHATESLRCDLSALDGYTAKQLTVRAIDLVKRFYATQNAILVVDEIAYLGSTGSEHREALEPLLRIIADKITTLSSSGKKRQQAVWTIAPEFVAGSLTQDAKAVKKLNLCYVSIHPQKTVDWNGQSIGFDWGLFNQIKANFTITDPTSVPNDDRICFVSGNWLPLGKLPTIEKVEKPNAVPQHSPKDVRAQLEKSFQSTDIEENDNSESAIRKEMIRFLAENPGGAKPRDFANRARSPVRRMPTEEIKLFLDVMVIDGEVLEVGESFFPNIN
ncbi:hypothetical protein LEP3755_30520 [Leptolyngbya sp. NIES-3755]|nr:hypothetical protein LEP3755_30520 [Leptolyngbya sp. NIES-3755]